MPKPVRSFDVIFKIQKRVIAFDDEDALRKVVEELSHIPVLHVDVISIKEVNIIKDPTPKFPIGSGSINDQYEFNK